MRGKIEEAKKTLKFMYPNRSEEERGIIYAEYEYTLNQEAEKASLVSGYLLDLLNNRMTYTIFTIKIDEKASFLDLFRGTDLRRTFCAFFPAITSSLAGNVLTGPQKTYLYV